MAVVMRAANLRGAKVEGRSTLPLRDDVKMVEIPSPGSSLIEEAGENDLEMLWQQAMRDCGADIPEQYR